MLECSWKSSFGIECFMCGFQRAFLFLIRGDFLESLRMFPALIPFLFTFIFVGFYIFIPIKNGHKIVIASFSTSVGLMLIGYFGKMAHWWEVVEYCAH